MRHGDRLYRYGGDEFAASCPAPTTSPPTTSPGGSAGPSASAGRPTDSAGPPVGRQRRRRLLPGRRQDEGRTRGDRRSRAVPGRSPRTPRRRGPSADPYLRALDETALALLDRRDQDGCSTTSSGARPPCSGPRTATLPAGPEARLVRSGSGPASSPVRRAADAGSTRASAARASRPGGRSPSTTTTPGRAARPDAARDLRLPSSACRWLRVGPGRRHPGPGRRVHRPDAGAAATSTR